MPRPVHFEMNFEDPESAKAFYGKVFGWTSRSTATTRCRTGW